MRIDWTSQACEPEEVFLENARHARSLGLPFVTKGERGSLAVAGGGPSLARNLDKLKDYDEVWGINRTARWLIERGINATFFTVDPQYMPGMTDVESAIVATSVHPKILDELNGKDVRLFELEPEGGPSSACRAIPLAVNMGFTSMTFFGCEGSYEGKSHSYATEVQRHQCIIRAGGKDYITQPDFQLQCQWLVPFLKNMPQYFKEESGGLLRAMLKHPRWKHVAFSHDIYLKAGLNLSDFPKYEVRNAG